jgi:NAD(P)H-dependent FMN reductase
MTKPRIAIILSTTRDGRFADKPGKWIADALQAHGELDAEMIDLRDHDLPFFNERATNAWVPTQNAEGRRWQKKVAEFDGYIFVTAEYNRSVPGVLKNAIDYAYNEWNRKPAAYVGYGSVGGARSVEHLRTICVELQMAPMRTGVHIGGTDFFAVSKGKATLESLEHLKPSVKDMLDQLAWWTRALKAARDKGSRIGVAA